MLSALLVACARHEPVQETRVLMDTFATITVYDRDKSREAMLRAVDAAFEGMLEVELRTSCYRDSSEVSKVNRAAPRPVEASPLLCACLEEARRVSLLSDGAFDVTVGPLMRLWDFLSDHPRVPDSAAIRALLPLVDFRRVHLEAGRVWLDEPGMALDLGGIAKGLAVDVAIDSLRAHGITDAMVDARSNLRTLASALTAGKRRVWIRHPRDNSKLFARFRMDEGCVATSGDYERFFMSDSLRYHHILDPHTGWPARSCASVTVIANSAMEADALSTALFVLGPERGLALAERLPGVEAVVLIDNHGSLEWQATAGLRDRLEVVKN
ncbi:MAG: FAD:protein FMN transferase [bacterium]|jgi:thiamine biosynthesis lipoprotein|nr:FAD:protein FMN transferase [candidate division KSB1 bacterium]MDH7561007.1 FAD:protein FMN transferase [bacterium]